MKRTLFSSGFSSPANEYGIRPVMGLSMTDVKNFFKATSTPATPVAPAVVPAAPQTILGMDQNTVLIGGAILLGLGLVLAIVAGRKAAKPTTAPARK